MLGFPQCDGALILGCCNAGSRHILAACRYKPLEELIYEPGGKHGIWEDLVRPVQPKMCELLRKRRRDGENRISLRVISRIVTEEFQVLQPNMGPYGDTGHHATALEHPEAPEEDMIYLPLNLAVPPETWIIGQIG